MTSPEDAAARARAEADRRRAAGGYADVGESGELSGSIVQGDAGDELLAQWALIEIDPDEVIYSTRSAGAPITFVKRLLVRLLRQYLVEIEARQTRFNIALLARLGTLEERVERLEAERNRRAAAPRVTVHQVLSAAGPFDAVSVQARLWRSLLTEHGYGGADHAAAVDPRARADFQPLAGLSPAPGDLIVLRWSTYSPRLLPLLEWPQRKLLVYHNVTPPGYFWNHQASVAVACAVGRAQLPRFARAADVAVADSGFNAGELRAAGAPGARVLPILFDPSRLGPRGQRAGGRRAARARREPPGAEQAPRPGDRRVRGLAGRARPRRPAAVRR